MRRVLLTLCLLLPAAARPADLQAIIHDVEQVHRRTNPDGIQLVFWFPKEYWLSAAATATPAAKASLAKLSDAMAPYSLFAVLDADISALAGIEPKSRADLLLNTTLLVNGEELDPVPESESPPMVRMCLNLLQPMIANLLGQMGTGIQFFIYPNRAGANSISALRPGSFVYTVYDTKFAWKLPLGSFLPPKHDAKTGAVFPGDYLYNPYTGDRLVAAPAADVPAGATAARVQVSEIDDLWASFGPYLTSVVARVDQAWKKPPPPSAEIGNPIQSVTIRFELNSAGAVTRIVKVIPSPGLPDRVAQDCAGAIAAAAPFPAWSAEMIARLGKVQTVALKFTNP
jgi:hypothetical protein